MSDPLEQRVHFYRSLHEARLLDARAAVYAGMYINGLAVTAIMAFFGSLMSKTDPQIHHGHGPRAFVWALGFFGAGVLCAATAAAVSYVANHNYAEAQSPHDLDVHRNNRRLWTATLFHQLGYGACFASLGCFAVGVVWTVVGFDYL